VHDDEDLSAIVGEPVLGLIPQWDGSAADGVSMVSQPQSPRSESYRRLRSNLEFVRRGGSEATAIVITSSMPHEGKTTTAVNLAVALAELGDRVLLIDADMRRPSIALMTRMEGTVGLSSVLIGKVPLEFAVQKWGDLPLDVLTSGEVPPNPLHLIDSQAMLDLVKTARDEYDFVVVDSPPLLSVVDAAVLSHQCDGPLIVAAADRTKRKHLAAARDALTVAGVDPIGLVLTRARHDGTRDYRGYANVDSDRASIRGWITRIGRALKQQVRAN
jgi:capsular exopolysaccharide synthesis family protein